MPQFINQKEEIVTEAHTQLKPGDIVPIRPYKPFYFDKHGARLV